MRLNALSPPENPMEQLLYCFGGPDDGGNGGGSTHPGRPGGESGERGNRSDRGDGNDRDDRGGGFDPGFDEGDTGDTGGFDPGFDAGDTGDTGGFDPGFDAGDTGDTGGFGGFGGRDGTAGAAGSNIDDLIEQSTAFGYGPNIQSTDVPSQAEVSAAIAAGVPAVQAQTTGFTAPSVGAGLTGRAPGDMGGDTSIERDVFGTDEDEYSTQDIFEVDPTGLGFETPQERIAREKAENTRAAARAAAAERAKVASEQAQREALQRSFGIPERDIAMQSRLDAMNALADQAMIESEADVQAMIDQDIAARESRPSARESRGIDSLMGGTIYGVPDDLGKSEDIGENQSAAVPGINVNIGPAESQADVNRAAEEALEATGLSTPTQSTGPGLFDTSMGEPVDRSVPSTPTERTVNGVPVTDTAERAVIDIENYQSIDDRTEEESKAALAEAKANLEAARAEAYRDKQFGFDTGLPESIDVFGFQAPTGIGIAERVADALFDSEATLANAIAEYGIKSVDDEEAERAANYNPQGLEVVTSGGPLSEGGRTVAYDARGNIVYDSRGIGGQIGDLLTGNRPPENIQALYDKQRAIDDAQREREGGGDGGGQPIIPPIEDIFEEPQAPERVPFELSEYQYEPRAPVQYSYTGLPTLAPFVLRPSRTSNRDFIRPTYDFGGLGSLRRS